MARALNNAAALSPVIRIRLPRKKGRGFLEECNTFSKKVEAGVCGGSSNMSL